MELFDARSAGWGLIHLVAAWAEQDGRGVAGQVDFRIGLPKPVAVEDMGRRRPVRQTTKRKS